MKEVVYKPLARKALRHMPANTARRIVGKIEAYTTDPASQQNNVKALKGRDAIRLRVGDWRVIFTSEPDRVIVHDVGPRGSIYG